MGAVIQKGKKKKDEKNNLIDDDMKYIKDQGYDEDTIDSANLALAINRGDFTSNVQISFSCENLPKMDLMSQSDPIIAVFQTLDGKKDFVGVTEYIPDCSNPKFVKSFIFSYNVSKDQNPITVDIFDVDDFNNYHNCKLHDFIGSVTFTLNDVMLSQTQPIVRDIYNPKMKKKKCGQLLIRGQEYDTSGKKAVFELGARDIMSKHELYLKISSMGNGRENFPIYCSQPEKKMKKQVINWKKFSVPLSSFGTNDKVYVKLEVLEYFKEKGHVLIGEIETTMQNLIESSGKSLKLTMNSLMVGELRLYNVYLDHRVTFLNHLLNDAEVSLITAVDFTNSNKQQDDPQSLHYTHTDKNQYFQALNNLVGVLQYFDSDNRIPFYGFGAKLPPYYNIVSHCFAVNGNIFNPNINGGSDNLVSTYKEEAPNLKMHGPTVFSEIISMGSMWAQKETNPKNYFIMLIVTDGINNDTDNTIDEIVQASQYPLTIIIVGIGDEDFSQLRDQLTPKNPSKFLYSKKYQKCATRDNIHFFEYKQYNKNMETLARECLRKLPKQFMDYMESKNITVTQQGKNMKEATEAYMHKKIDQKKNALKKKKYKNLPGDKWLEIQKKEFKKCLYHLGYEEIYINQILKKGIASHDVNLFIEHLSILKQIEKEEKELNKPQPKESKQKINKRLDIPYSTLQATKISKDPKIGQKIFKVKQINQLDLLIKQNKQDTNKKQQKFIQAIQLKEPDDYNEEQQKQKKLKFLENKYEKYIQKSNQAAKNNIQSKNQKLNSRRSSSNIYGQKQLVFKGDFDNSSDEDENDIQQIYPFNSQFMINQIQQNNTNQKFNKTQDYNYNQHLHRNMSNSQNDRALQRFNSHQNEEDEVIDWEKQNQSKQLQQLTDQSIISNDRVSSSYKFSEEIKKQQKVKCLILENDLHLYKKKENRCHVCDINLVDVILNPCGDASICKKCFQDDSIIQCPVCGSIFQREKSMIVVPDMDYNSIYN